MFNLFQNKSEKKEEEVYEHKVPFDIIANPSPRKSEVIDLGNGRTVTVWDDFLITPWFDDLFKHITHANIPWYFNESVSNPKDGLFQFVHLYYNANEWISEDRRYVGTVLQTIHETFETDPILIRIKANLRPRSVSLDPAPLHTDCTWLTKREPAPKWKTGILYVNNNNGHTFFENSDVKIESKENRFVVFDSDIAHSGTAATDEPRYLINFNWF
jgi:hypothetical protein